MASVQAPPTPAARHARWAFAVARAPAQGATRGRQRQTKDPSPSSGSAGDQRTRKPLCGGPVEVRALLRSDVRGAACTTGLPGECSCVASQWFSLSQQPGRRANDSAVEEAPPRDVSAIEQPAPVGEPESAKVEGSLREAPPFVIGLSPGEGIPLFRTLGPALELREVPSADASVVQRLESEPGTEITYDAVQFQTVVPRQVVAVETTSIAGRNFGAVQALSRDDYYDPSQSRVGTIDVTAHRIGECAKLTSIKPLWGLAFSQAGEGTRTPNLLITKRYRETPYPANFAYLRHFGAESRRRSGRFRRISPLRGAQTAHTA